MKQKIFTHSLKFLAFAAPFLMSLPLTAGNLIMENYDKVAISSSDLAETEKKLAEKKEIQVKDELPLKPYHQRVPNPRVEGKLFCSVCHQTPPHSQGKSRAFLNAHVGKITCEVCHLSKATKNVEYKPFPIGEPTAMVKSRKRLARKDSATMIAPFLQDEPVSLFKNDPFAEKIEKDWKDATLREKAEMKLRLHRPLEKKGRKCAECHQREQELFHWNRLGYSEDEARRIENNLIADFFKNTDDSEKKIKISELLKR